ncbi:MAG: glycosyltransferase [Gemmatimonadota bacterium]
MTAREVAEAGRLEPFSEDRQAEPSEAARASQELDVSVVVPVIEPPDPFASLYHEFTAPIRSTGRSFEFLVVTEPDYMHSVEPLRELARAGEPVRVLEVGQRLGESALLKIGEAHARGRIIVTLPAVRKVQADALPELVSRIEEGTDLVVARRWPRRDPWINRLQTRVVDWLTGRLAGWSFHDMGCGVHAMRREVLREMPLYGEFHRFLPLLAHREGFEVVEVASPQHPTDRRVRIFSPWRYLRRLVDALGVFFLLRFTDRPLRFFGILGSLLAVVGGVILGMLFVQRLGGQPIADRPLLVLGVLIFTLGVQAFALGLVGEIIVHLHAPAKRPYRVRERSETATEAP